MDPHTGFIVTAFAVTVLVLGGAIAAVLLDYRAQSRTLARLSAADGRRSQVRAAGQDDAS